MRIGAASNPAARRSARRLSYLKAKWPLYAMLLLPFAFLVLFNYVPMYGAILAFKDFKIRLGILRSPWMDQHGLGNFIRFFNNYNFWPVLRNTLILSCYTIAASFPCAIMLAVSLNYARNVRYRKAVQMASYFPYFISTIVMVGIINMMFNMRTGVLGRLYAQFTGGNILAQANLFPHLYVWSDIWQKVGFNTIIYIAALTSVDPEQHEAATIDGATLLQRIRHIDFPAILPTAMIMLILNMGSILNVGYEKALAMQNQNNLGMSEIISTYSYKVALVATLPDFSYGTSIGLFQSLIGLILVLITNKVANVTTGSGMW